MCRDRSVHDHFYRLFDISNTAGARYSILTLHIWMFMFATRFRPFSERADYVKTIQQCTFSICAIPPSWFQFVIHVEPPFFSLRSRIMTLLITMYSIDHIFGPLFFDVDLDEYAATMLKENHVIKARDLSFHSLLMKRKTVGFMTLLDKAMIALIDGDPELMYGALYRNIYLKGQAESPDLVMYVFSSPTLTFCCYNILLWSVYQEFIPFSCYYHIPSLPALRPFVSDIHDITVNLVLYLH